MADEEDDDDDMTNGLPDHEGETEDTDSSHSSVLNRILVAEVSQHPVIYAKLFMKQNTVPYKNKKKIAWENVASAVRPYVVADTSDVDLIAFCEKRWITIRGAFNRSLRNQRKATSEDAESGAVRPYKPADALDFLVPHLTARKTYPSPSRGHAVKLPAIAGAVTLIHTLPKSIPAYPLVSQLARVKSTDTEKLPSLTRPENFDEIDLKAHAWVLQIKRLSVKRRREVVRGIQNLIDRCEDEDVSEHS